MPSKKVVASKNLRCSFNVFAGLTLWLFMDRLGVPAYVHGIVWTLYALFLVGVLIQYGTTEQVDIFKEEEKDHGST